MLFPVPNDATYSSTLTAITPCKTVEINYGFFWLLSNIKNIFNNSSDVDESPGILPTY